jgi:tRNA nucleotidyltransferase (CCA-adding enzyme)
MPISSPRQYDSPGEAIVSPIQRAIRPSSAVKEIAERLERAGYETWCVGGAVRDALLGEEHLDWDLATAARPEQVKEVFGYRRTIPVGVEFGTVGVLDRHGRLHEVTTFRRDVRTDGRHAVVEFGASLDEDLARRDFTINAIAYHPGRDELVDPFGGREDLATGVVRAVGDPAARMSEDRLRALRALRFGARFGFRIDPATWQAVIDSSPHLGRLSAERVKQELEKTMDQVRRPSEALTLWITSGSMGTLIPELRDVPQAQLDACDNLAQPGLARRPTRRIARLAVLFLHLEPRQALEVAGRLRFSKADSQSIFTVVDRWRRIGSQVGEALEGGKPDDTAVRRWVAAIGRVNLPLVVRVVAAALAGGERTVPERAVVSAGIRSLYRRLLRSAYRDPVEIQDLAIDGDDLRRAGIPPGPVVGKILHALLDLVIAEPAGNTPERLLDEARRLWKLYAGESGPTTQTGER